jgi:hypothetical protein
MSPYVTNTPGKIMVNKQKLKVQEVPQGVQYEMPE